MDTMRPMKPNSIFLVKVWPASVRVAHWLVAGGFLVLMTTGWILRSGRYLGEAPADFHVLASYPLLAGVALRIWVLVAHPAVGGWRALWPSADRLRAVPEMLKFYLSFGRLDLPRWFAHNPFWAPIYLLWILALAAQAGLGVVLLQGWGEDAVVRAWHAGLAEVLVAVFGFHLVAVVLHELRARRCDVSAMIHGWRVFDLPPLEGTEQTPPKARVVRFEPRADSSRAGGKGRK